MHAVNWEIIMAQLPQCCGCSRSDFMGIVCEIYADGIPRDIHNETKPCDLFSPRHKENLNDDLPIAKGR